MEANNESENHNQFNLCEKIPLKIGNEDKHKLRVEKQGGKKILQNFPIFDSENKSSSYMEEKFDIFALDENNISTKKDDNNCSLLNIKDATDNLLQLDRSTKNDFISKNLMHEKIKSSGDEEDEEVSIPSFSIEEINYLNSLKSPNPLKIDSPSQAEYIDKVLKSPSPSKTTRPLSDSDKIFLKRVNDDYIKRSILSAVSRTNIKRKNMVRKKNAVGKLQVTDRESLEHSDGSQKYISERKDIIEESKSKESLVQKKQNMDVMEKRSFSSDEFIKVGEDGHHSKEVDVFSIKSSHRFLNTSEILKSDEKYIESKPETQGENTKVDHMSKMCSSKYDRNIDSRTSPSHSPKKGSLSPNRNIYDQPNKLFNRNDKWLERGLENKHFERHDEKYSERKKFERSRRGRNNKIHPITKYSRNRKPEADREVNSYRSRYDNKSKYNRSRSQEKDRETRQSPDRSDDKSSVNKSTVREKSSYSGEHYDKLAEGLEDDRENKTSKENERKMLLKDSNLEKGDKNVDNLSSQERDEIKHSSDKCGDRTVNVKSKDLEWCGESKHSFGNYDDDTINLKYNREKYRKNRYSDDKEDDYNSRRRKRRYSSHSSSAERQRRRRRRTRSSSSSSTSSSSSSSSSPGRKSWRYKRRSRSRSPRNRFERNDAWQKVISPRDSTFHFDVNPSTRLHPEPPEVSQLRELKKERDKFMDEENKLRRELNFLSEQRKQLLKADFTDDNPILVNNNKYQNELENKVKFIHETVNSISRRITAIQYLTSNIHTTKNQTNTGFLDTNYGKPGFQTTFNSSIANVQQPGLLFGIDLSRPPPSINIPLHSREQPQHVQQTVSQNQPLPVSIVPPHNLIPVPQQTSNLQNIPLQPASLSGIPVLGQHSPHLIDSEQSMRGILPQTSESPLKSTLVAVSTVEGQQHLDIEIDHQSANTKVPLTQTTSQSPAGSLPINTGHSQSDHRPLTKKFSIYTVPLKEKKDISPLDDKQFQSELKITKLEKSKSPKRKSEEILNIFKRFEKNPIKKTRSDVINVSDESCDNTEDNSNHISCQYFDSEIPDSPGEITATQKRALMEQRNTYVHKMKVLQRELEFLTDQRKQLTNDLIPLTDPILKTNEQKQVEVQEKLEDIKTCFDKITAILEQDGPTGENKNTVKETSEKKVILDGLKITKNSSSSLPSIVGCDYTLQSTSKVHDTAVKDKSTEKPKIQYKNNNLKSTTENVWSDEDIWKPLSNAKTNLSPGQYVSNASDKTTEEQTIRKSEETKPTYLLKEEMTETENKTTLIETDKKSDVTKKAKFNYIYYDSEMHWCRVCNVFPKTAKEYLNHLHSAEHRACIMEKQLFDLPWHNEKSCPEKLEHEPGAPVKRVPIKGLQFFVSATAWYCKICSTWIGDLHCASIHLKSSLHSERYANFIQENPEWEMEWLIERTRAFEHTTKNMYQSNDNQIMDKLENCQNDKKLSLDIAKEKQVSSELKNSKTLENIDASNETETSILKTSKNPSKEESITQEVKDVEDLKKNTVPVLKEPESELPIKLPETIKTKENKVINQEFISINKPLNSSENDNDKGGKSGNNDGEGEDYDEDEEGDDYEDNNDYGDGVGDDDDDEEEEYDEDEDEDMNMKIKAALEEIKDIKLKMQVQTKASGERLSERLISVLKVIRETKFKMMLKAKKRSLVSSSGTEGTTGSSLSVVKNLEEKSVHLEKVKENKLHYEDSLITTDGDMKKSIFTAMKNKSLPSMTEKGGSFATSISYPKLPDKDQNMFTENIISPDSHTHVVNDWNIESNIVTENQKQDLEDKRSNTKNANNSQPKIYSRQVTNKRDIRYSKRDRNDQGNKADNEQRTPYREEGKPSRNKMDTEDEKKYSRYNSNTYSSGEKRFSDNGSSNKYQTDNRHSRSERYEHAYRYGSNYRHFPNRDRYEERSSRNRPLLDECRSRVRRSSPPGCIETSNKDIESVNKNLILAEKKVDKGRISVNNQKNKSSPMEEEDETDFDKLVSESVSKKKTELCAGNSFENDTSAFTKSGKVKFTLKNKSILKQSNPFGSAQSESDAKIPSESTP